MALGALHAQNLGGFRRRHKGDALPFQHARSVFVQQVVHPRALYSVRQFADRHPAFTQSSLRALIDKARDRHSSKGRVPGNGLAPAILRVGRRVLIDEERFFQWLVHQNETRRD